MSKVCVIGHFGYGYDLLNGQTIKTKNITKALNEEYSSENVGTIDTHGGMSKLPIIIFKAILASYGYKNIIMLPAHNGIKFFTPLLAFLSKVTSCKMHYVVIGGWLCSFLKEHHWLINNLKCFFDIYVETSSMKANLEAMGFTNVFVMPNFKFLHILKPEELVYQYEGPFKLCTFSRVMKEKGIEDAIEAVKSINQSFGKVVYELDIYGQVDDGYKDQFNTIISSVPSYIRYCGNVKYDESTEVLKDYFLLLFPTKFYTEGIPGTIIDAYSAGVPVVSSRWENFSDLVDEGKVGYGYKFASDELRELLLDIYKNGIDKINKMKKECVLKANEYMPNRVIKIITKELL